MRVEKIKISGFILSIALIIIPGTTPISAEITAAGNQVLHQDNCCGVSIGAEFDDGFGLALASGDFDGDRFQDLAVGSPTDLNSFYPEVVPRFTGSVTIFYGSENGFAHMRTQILFGQNRGDRFGQALAAGDFNKDGYDDLAVGAPYHERSGGAKNAGEVRIFYGSERYGLDWNRAYGLCFPHFSLDQDTPGVKGSAEPEDRFGSHLIAKDLNNDYYDDLVVGIPDEDIKSIENAGAIQIFYGRICHGLSTADDEILHQNSEDIKGEAEKDDHFGKSLAAADFDNDGHVDLAIGAPFEDIGNIKNAGIVHIIYGDSSGPSSRNEIWHQDSGGIKGKAEKNDLFGWSLATGNLDGVSSFDDLVIGVPFEDIGNIKNAGMVQILFGDSNGLSSKDEIWHQNIMGIEGKAEEGDYFGWSIDVAHLDSKSGQELVIGVPYEDIGKIEDAGMVQILFGTSKGITVDGDEMWHQNISGILGECEKEDLFGWALVTGGFKRGARSSLAIGVPREKVQPTGGYPGQGMVQVLYND